MSEPNKPEILNEVWESYNSYTEVPNSKEVDGVHILAKVSGPAFFPDQTSGNKVFYSQKLWEDILKQQDVQNQLDARTMYGTIGHDIEIDDNTLREGIASHITTKMWIDEETNIGMAEYLILNTKVGRVLNTLLRAGSKLKVSTKAKGLFNPRRRPDDSRELTRYFFKRIDFVITPGFEGALPEITESLNQEELEILQSLTNSNENGSPDQTVEANTMSDQHLALLQKNLEESQARALKAEATNESLQKQLDEYKEIGTPAEINESLDEAEAKIEELTQSNTNVNESLVNANSELSQLKTSIAEVNEAKNQVPEEVSESLRELEQYKQIGTVDEINTLMDIHEALAELGTPEEIKQLVEISEAEIETKFNDQIQAIAKAANVDESTVRILADNAGNNLVEVSEMLRVTDKLNDAGKAEDTNENLRPNHKQMRGLLVKPEEANENKRQESRFGKSNLAASLLKPVSK